MHLESKLNFQKSCNFYILLILVFARILYIFPNISLIVADNGGGRWPTVTRSWLEVGWWWSDGGWRWWSMATDGDWGGGSWW